MRKTKIIILCGLIVAGFLAVTNFAFADGEWAIISGTSNIHNTNSGNVGIGTTSPGSTLTVSNNLATLQPPITGTAMQIGQADGTGNVLLLDSYSNGTAFIGRRAQGTAALPSAISGSGINLTSLAGYGYGATGYSNGSRAEVRFLSEQAWTDTAQGTRISFFTTLNGTTTPLERLTIKHGGNIGIGTTSPSKKLTVAGQIQVAGSSDYNRIEVIGTSSDYNNNGFRLQDAGHLFNMALDSNGSYLINEFTGSSWPNRFTIKNGGNIGFGTINPGAKLTVNNNAIDLPAPIINTTVQIGQADATGNLMLLDAFGAASVFVGRRANGTNAIRSNLIGGQGFAHMFGYGYGTTGYSSGPRAAISFSCAQDWTDTAQGTLMTFRVTPNNSTTLTEAMRIDNTGNIGIGTPTPQSTLAVNGTITTKKIKVTETGWPDFVFDNGYKLPTLNAVEDHIKQYKHLPGIPSAREIQKKGLDVSDVLAKQMQKIEELTLYMIEMQKKNEEIQKENQDLKKRVNALEKQISQN